MVDTTIVHHTDLRCRFTCTEQIRTRSHDCAEVAPVLHPPNLMPVSGRVVGNTSPESDKRVIAPQYS